MKKRKRIALISFVIIELIIGGIFLSKYYQKKQFEKNELRVAAIDKKRIIFSKNENLEHYWEFEPNSSYDEKPNWLISKASYQINSDGLNDRFEYQIEKPQNTYRIVTLGDSYTFGHFISTPDNWTEKLEDSLNNMEKTCGYDRFEVINLGMPGFDVQYTINRYMDIGKKYNPDLIIWFESGSGFSRFNEISTPIVDDCKKSQPQDTLNQKKQAYYYCFYKARDYLEENYQKEYLDNFLYTQLSSFLDSAQQEKVVFFYYQDTWSENNDAMIKKLKDNYPYTSFEKTVPIPLDEERLPDTHPNKKGHEIISKSIYNYLITKRLQCQ